MSSPVSHVSIAVPIYIISPNIIREATTCGMAFQSCVNAKKPPTFYFFGKDYVIMTKFIPLA